MAGKPTAIQPAIRPGKTFTLAVWTISLLIVAQLIVISYAMMSRVDWSVKPGGSTVGAGEMSEEEILNREAELLERLKMPTARVETPAPLPVSIPEAPSGPGAIYDEETMELVSVGCALKVDGDMSGALEKFRSADARTPENPRILYEMASVYNTLGIADKASVYWQQIWKLGPVAAGDYYAIADLHLRGGANGAEPRRPEAKLYVNQAFIKRHPEVTDGEQVTVRVSIKAVEGAQIDITKLFIDFPFFDLADGRSVVPTMSNTPVQTWVTPPVDWAGQSEEILDMVYFFPKMSADEIRAIGQREYYGFVVKLYYDDVLQDIYSYPRTLLDQIRREREPNGPNIDDSLFPRD